MLAKVTGRAGREGKNGMEWDERENVLSVYIRFCFGRTGQPMIWFPVRERKIMENLLEGMYKSRDF